MGEGTRRAWLVAATVLLSTVVAASQAAAAARTVVVSYRNPSSADVAGVALYHGTSRSDVDHGLNLTRIDLGRQAPDSSGVIRVTLSGFDDTRDYYMALRSYDSSQRESANSNVGLLPASAPALPAGTIYSENFDSYAPGADPSGWVDSGPGVASAGDASLFSTDLAAGSAEAFGAASSAGDLNATLVASGSAAWASYEFTGRVESDSTTGSTGVSVLSAYPDAQFYYRLAKFGVGPFKLMKIGTGSLDCASSTSTGVTGDPGEWLRFRVRVTRFDGRNRVRAAMWPDGSAAPASFQADCWDADPESVSSGRVGVYSSGASGSHWDDLVVASIAPDGAPPGYGGSTAPPPPPSGYASESSVAHWWKPGWDLDDIGRDFAASGGIDADVDGKGVSAKDISQGGTTAATLDLDGTAEALGDFTLKPYGIADTWSLGAWVRPAKVSASSKPRYILELNGTTTTDALDRISLSIDANGHFGIEVSDLFARTRAISSPAGLSLSKTGDTWYFVVVVKTANQKLALFVNGVEVASTTVGVPSQSDVARVLRIGGRVTNSTGYFWKGGIGSVALWRSALKSSEISALYASGDRGAAIRPTLLAQR